MKIVVCSKAVCLLLVCLLAGGCNASLKSMIAGDQSKMAMLQENVERFSRARYWGSYNEALSFAEPQVQQTLLRRWKQSGANEKLVELNVTDASFDAEGDASVEVAVRYFEQPSYLVRTRTERQLWRYYRLNGGWLLHEVTETTLGAGQ